MFLSFTCKFCVFKVVVVPPTVKSPVSVRFAPCAVPVKVGAVKVLFVKVCVPVKVVTVEFIDKVTSPEEPPPDSPVPAKTDVMSDSSDEVSRDDVDTTSL